jgi:hypothetical protein
MKQPAHIVPSRCASAQKARDVNSGRKTPHHATLCYRADQRGRIESSGGVLKDTSSIIRLIKNVADERLALSDRVKLAF